MKISKERWKGLAGATLGVGIANLLFISSIRFFGEHNVVMTKFNIATGIVFILISGAIYFFAVRPSK